MAKSKLEIFVTADTDKAVNALGKVGSASETLGSDTKKLGGGLSILDGAMMAVGGMAVNMATSFVKSIPEMVELGVAADRAELALVGYAGSSKEAAEYTDAVRDAANGAISEMDAMENASRLLAMGLVGSKDEASKLTEIAITLGASMGKGPKAAFEEFTLMLANQSIPRLDTFGISAGQVRERMEELADENANLDRQTRFTMATIEIAEGRLIDLDEAGFNATSSIDQLKAIMSDMKVEAASALSDGIMPLIDGIIELREANIENIEAALETSETLEEYITQLYDLKDGAVKLNPEIIATAKATWEVELASRDLSNAAYDLHEEYRLGKVVFEDAEDAVRDYKSELDALSTLIDNKVGKAYDKFKDQQLTQIGIILDLEDELKNLEAAFTGTDDEMEAINGVTEKLETQREKLQELEDKHDEQTKKMIFNMAAQRAAVDGEVDVMELKLMEGLAESFDLIDDRQVAATLGIESAFKALAMPGAGPDVALQTLLGVAAAIDSIPDSKQVDVFINTFLDPRIFPGGYVPGYQHGGQFTVGGHSGPDRNLVAFRATQGEKVTITPPGAKSGGGKNIIINFSGPVYADPYELERLVLPIVEKGIRADQARN